MTEHYLKTWAQFFPALISKAKQFEIRKDDRGFEVGDLLILEEWDVASESYTGQKLYKQITYITKFQQQSGYVVMGIRDEGQK
jgi:hypothetical protein